MSTAPELRPATEADADEIARIHVRCWREVYAFMPPQVQAQRGFDYRLSQWLAWFAARPAGEALFVLEAGDRVVGFAIARPNQDAEIDAAGEFHACYILPEFRGGASGPLAMTALAEHLKGAGLWPACIWAFKSNPYRRIYPALGCVPTVFRDRVIAGARLAEIGYRVSDYDGLMARLDRMRASADRHRSGSPRPPRRLSHRHG